MNGISKFSGKWREEERKAGMTALQKRTERNHEWSLWVADLQIEAHTINFCLSFRVDN